MTGSTGGIGFAIAKGLAHAGAAVVLNGRQQKAVDEAISKLKGIASNAPVRGVAADLDFFETPDEEWERFLAINVMSGVRLSRAYLPRMKARNWGRVIFVSSEFALNIPADMIHYGVTKTAGLALSRGLAKRMAGTGVTVNAILPGPTLSEGVREMLRPEQENRQANRGCCR